MKSAFVKTKHSYKYRHSEGGFKSKKINGIHKPSPSPFFCEILTHFVSGPFEEVRLTLSVLIIGHDTVIVCRMSKHTKNGF